MKRSILSRIKCAFNTANNTTEFIFHLGYQGLAFPRSVRKVVAKSKWHQAWHSGYFGGGILSILERHQINDKSCIHD